MGLWVILNILVFSSISFSNGENLSFHTSFWDLLSLDRLNNPWRQDNLLGRKPEIASRPINCLETAFRPINHLGTVRGPISVFWKLFLPISATIALQTRTRDIKHTWIISILTSLVASPPMAYLTSISKSVKFILYQILI